MRHRVHTRSIRGDSQAQHNCIAAMLTVTPVECDRVRKTNESPPRVAVYDVIAAVKNSDQNYAGQMYKCLLDAGKRQSFAVSVRGSSRAVRRSQLRQLWPTSGAPSVATCDP